MQPKVKLSDEADVDALIAKTTELCRLLCCLTDVGEQQRRVDGDDDGPFGPHGAHAARGDHAADGAGTGVGAATHHRRSVGRHRLLSLVLVRCSIVAIITI